MSPKSKILPELKVRAVESYLAGKKSWGNIETMKMKTTRRILRGIGERLIFGIDEGQIEPFLTRRGFRDVRNTDSEELKRFYFTARMPGA